MKKSTTQTSPPSAEEKTEGKNVLHLRRRPVADLTESQMDDVAGGHPHNTCDPTCPPTCCPTCPNTCRNCPEPSDPVTCQTCPADCPTQDYDDAGC